MDDSFRARVDKIFGSLTSCSSCLQSTLWTLTDDEVERKQWRRDTVGGSDRDDLPCSSSFDYCFKKERRRNTLPQGNLDDADVEPPLNRSRRGGDEDEWEIRSSIGLDRTLDNEEEEDEFDKLASGRENAGERLYMKNVTDHKSYLNFNIFSKSLHHGKDPRANHIAAKIRLQEDEVEAQKLNSASSEIKEQPIKPSYGEGDEVKSILKRKGNNSDSKSQKRVRFDPDCTVVCEEADLEEDLDSSMHTCFGNGMVSNNESMSVENPSKVPDYLRNPSNYIRYSFDSLGELDEKSNTQACMDYLSTVRSAKAMEMRSELEDGSTGIPKSVTFIAKKKTSEAKEENTNQSGQQPQEQVVGAPVGIAASDYQPSEVGTAAEDESEMRAMDQKPGFQKPGRRYRTKLGSDDGDA